MVFGEKLENMKTNIQITNLLRLNIIHQWVSVLLSYKSNEQHSPLFSERLFISNQNGIRICVCHIKTETLKIQHSLCP